MKRLILASASPRRKEILSLYFKEFEVIPADTDESVSPDLSPEQVVRSLAVRKARACADLTGDASAVYIGSDTVVSVGGQILGKPRDRADARRMLTLLSDAWHEVWSGICVIKDGTEYAGAECTRVKFRSLSDAQVARYADSGECDDKAGAYAVQGIGGVLVERIDGSYQNVVGLPVVTLDRLLMQAGEEGLL